MQREIEVSMWRVGAGFQPVWARVVGVVRHLRHRDPSASLREQLYLPLLQQPRNQLAVAVRIGILAALLPMREAFHVAPTESLAGSP